MNFKTRVSVLLVSTPVLAFVIVGGLMGNTSIAGGQTSQPYQQLGVFQDVVSLVMNNYVGEVEVDKVMDGAMRGLADGMDFYRDEKNKDAVIKYLGEFYKSNNTEELEETRRVYTQVSPGLPVVTVKSMENMIASDKLLSTMNISGADVMDLSFLKQLEEERQPKK